MIAKQRVPDQISRHIDWLASKVAGWRLPAGVDSEDIILESIEAFWQSKSIAERDLHQQQAWLLRTASNKKHEQIRFASRCCCIDVDQQETVTQPQDESNLRALVDEAFQRSMVWEALTANQRYVIVQCVMLGRSPASVAAELDLKRQTVTSWASRIPDRLAKDPAFQKLKRQREVKDGQ